MKVSILGTGNVATKLGKLINAAGYDVFFGSVNADEKKESLSFGKIGSFKDAARNGDAVILAIPYHAVKDAVSGLKDELSGKIVVDATNPVNSDWSPIVLGAENSAGEEIARLLPGASVVKAFNTIFADVMDQDINGIKITAFYCGNDEQANEKIGHLAEKMGFAPVNTGQLHHARYLEAMAHLNIALAVNKGYGTQVAFKYMTKN